MPKIPLHLHTLTSPAQPQTTETPESPEEESTQPPNPLPQFLHTPNGLAILELQGKINFELPPPSSTDSDPHNPEHTTLTLPIGHLSFPHDAFALPPAGPEKDAKGKTKAVVAYLYVGRYQRLRGEVKKLAKPWGVLVRRDGGGGGGGEEGGEAVEVVGVVRWRIVFSMRPEPV
ncbi:putative sister chromatid cohesion protein Ctf8 [Peziza echinospora]|nr:putative sister chromatid cohesion protein Ctf8 [Peziza echinospora]